MNDYATREDFDRSPVGQPFMEVCGACGLDTGSLLIKKVGPPGATTDWRTPRRVVNEGARCEYCTFLQAYFCQIDRDKNDGLQWGAAKLITRGSDGVDQLVAYVPFSSSEDRSSRLSDGTEFTFRHGMSILCEHLGDGRFHTIKVEEMGV